jgi:hypothetical protein
MLLEMKQLKDLARIKSIRLGCTRKDFPEAGQLQIVHAVELIALL